MLPFDSAVSHKTSMIFIKLQMRSNYETVTLLDCLHVSGSEVLKSRAKKYFV